MIWGSRGCWVLLVCAELLQPNLHLIKGKQIKDQTAAVRLRSGGWRARRDGNELWQVPWFSGSVKLGCDASTRWFTSTEEEDNERRRERDGEEGRERRKGRKRGGGGTKRRRHYDCHTDHTDESAEHLGSILRTTRQPIFDLVCRIKDITCLGAIIWRRLSASTDPTRDWKFGNFFRATWSVVGSVIDFFQLLRLQVEEPLIGQRGE